MSAILSVDDLNDFISPGVACIKPIESIPEAKPADPDNPYEVTTEDKAEASNPAPTKISLTDCLACSGCVTSAEAVLVSLQSHTEVLDTLDRFPALLPSSLKKADGYITPESDSVSATSVPVKPENELQTGDPEGKIFVASVSPQAKASLAAAYGVTIDEAGYMIDHLLSGESGLRSGGQLASDFLWVINTTRLREMALVLSADEVLRSSPQSPGTASPSLQLPVLTSACPGWICYVEKTHSNLIPHLSRVKSPQSLTGTLIKSVLWKALQVHPSQVWHLAVMPCFDKKLEASRAELTSASWIPNFSHSSESEKPVRDVDCVITPRELIALAEARGIDFGSLPRHPTTQRAPFPDSRIHNFLFPSPTRFVAQSDTREHGTSGGFLTYIAKRVAAAHPHSHIRVSQGRNTDVLEVAVESRPESSPTSRPVVHFRAARYYGFRNIQNLVRKLKPAAPLSSSHHGIKSSRLLAAAQASNQMSGVRKAGSGMGAARRVGVGAGGSGASQYAYVEVMACPGGCANGGGQLGIKDLEELKLRQISGVETDDAIDARSPSPETNHEVAAQPLPSKREWLAEVESVYFSSSTSLPDHQSASDDTAAAESPLIDGISHLDMYSLLEYWSQMTGIGAENLVRTTYRDVSANDILSNSKSGAGAGAGAGEDEIVAGLAVKVGGGW